MLRSIVPLALMFGSAACSAPVASVSAGAPVAVPVASAPPAKPSAPRFMEDDFAAATAKARAEGKVLFVDAWAPWCHTCLSMKNFVLADPALGALSNRVVFISIDTDKPEAGPFLEKHSVKAWPTFFVIDPRADRVVGYWAGSASLRELRGVIDEALAATAGTATDPTMAAFAAARTAHAGGDLVGAAKGYERALAAAPPGWPNRGAALVGWMETLAGSKAWAECARVGQLYGAQVEGSSAPGDFASYLLTCAGNLPSGQEQAAARQAAVASLRATTAHPSADASIDDRQDALDQLSEGLATIGDAAGARAAQEARALMLEKAAAAAKSPEVAQTFDYARANAYVALGRADEAVRMLQQRERELPDSYEPPGRLAGVLFKTDHLPEALAAIDRALARAYGPRKLRYLKLRADILAKRGELAAALATRREEVKGWESLPPGQASPGSLADARRRLEDAEKAGPR